MANKKSAGSSVWGCLQVLFWLSGLTLLVSCGASVLGIGVEEPPYRPRTYYETIDSVVIKDVVASTVKGVDGPIFTEDSKIAILGFRSPEDTQGGILVSDMFTALLRKQGYQVFERDQINRILEEQQLITDGVVSVSDLDVAETLGRLEAIDYMVFGAVTLYKIEAQSVYLPLKIVEEDREKYSDRYDEYKDWYLNHMFPFSLSLIRSEDENIKRLRHIENIWSIEDLEDEYDQFTKQEFRIIASIGISAKVVDVRTGEIIWTGQSETNDFTLVNGADRILNTFLGSIQTSN